MISRILLLTLLIGFAACTNSTKESANTNEEPKQLEDVKPDGVIIQSQSETDTLKGSLKAYATSKIGNTNFIINYYSPATRNRMIWGGLVAYNNVWVTGAHKATNIEFDHDIKIGDIIVPAGKYAIFTIPSENKWTAILNKNWNQHLADDYSEAEDVVRLIVEPETEDTHQERLRFAIEEEGNANGEIVMYWDKLEVSVPFTVIN